jgi:hypothetical protein
MKISGFTFVRNATKFGLPVVESIRSILPLVDEFIVNVGISEDRTLRMVRGIGSKKIRIIQNRWDDRWTERMRIYAVQTNIAMYQCTGDWLFYIQADEVVHEKDHASIYNSMARNLKDQEVQGLLFDWIHFWGSYRYFLDTVVNYQHEIRIIRNFLGISSWKDAQGFRLDGRRLMVKPSEGRIFHYGWVVPPANAVEKAKNHSTYFRGKKATKNFPIDPQEKFFYNTDRYLLSEFKGTHPAVMKERISAFKDTFDINRCLSGFRPNRKNFRTFLYRTFGLTPGEYRNYFLLK